MSKFRIAGVIPARLTSTRLSRKVLRIIAGRPMVEWVWRAAAQSGLMDPVVVATDSEEVVTICRERGIPVEMTSATCPSGSDRVREVAGRIAEGRAYPRVDAAVAAPRRRRAGYLPNAAVAASAKAGRILPPSVPG